MTDRPNEPTDPWELERFVKAQAGVHERALAELRAGRKQSHWMWFVFPQLAGLGFSSMAQRYAISGLDGGARVPRAPDARRRARRVCRGVAATRG